MSDTLTLKEMSNAALAYYGDSVLELTTATASWSFWCVSGWSARGFLPPHI